MTGCAAISRVSQPSNKLRRARRIAPIGAAANNCAAAWRNGSIVHHRGLLLCRRLTLLEYAVSRFMRTARAESGQVS